MRLAYILIFLITIPIASAAIIHGTVYDLSLNKVKNAVVTIDSIPSQKYVLQDGKYSFQVPIGGYIIKVISLKGDLVLDSETLNIKEEGDYNLDIVLFPEYDLNDSDIEDVYLPGNLEDLGSASNNFLSPVHKILVIILIVVLYFILRYLYKKYRKKQIESNEKDDLIKVIEIIKKEGGRINQKDLRKHFSLSEAKMSLLISELESKGKLEKIKKGRGNILVLK